MLLYQVSMKSRLRVSFFMCSLFPRTTFIHLYLISYIYFRMQLPCCFIVIASSVIFCRLPSIIASKLNITALNESVWTQLAAIKEDLDIQHSYPCPAKCICRHLRNPSRVQVLCQPNWINTDFTLLNQTSFLSELYLIRDCEMNRTSSMLYDGIYEPLHAFFKNRDARLLFNLCFKVCI